MNNNVHNLKHTENNILFVAFLGVLFFCLISGIGTGTNLIAAVLTVIFVFFFILKFGFANKKIFFLFWIYYFTEVISGLINATSLYYFLGTCVAYSLAVFAPFFLEMYLEKKNNKKLNNTVFYISTIVWFVVIVLSTITFMKNPDGGRAFVHNHRGTIMGGGYSAAYGSALIGVTLFNYLLTEKKLKKCLFLFLLFSLSFVHIVFTKSTITIAAFICGLVLSLFFHGKKNSSNVLTIAFIVIFVVFAIFFFVASKQIGAWLIEVGYKVNNSVFSQRIIEIGRLLYNSDESHHVENRISTLTTSWETFKANPIFGISYKYGNDYTLLYQNGIGAHSEVLDSLARFGIVGGLPLILLLFGQTIHVRNISSNRLFVPLFGTFCILVFINPFVSAQSIFALFLYVPLIVSFFENKN